MQLEILTARLVSGFIIVTVALSTRHFKSSVILQFQKGIVRGKEKDASANSCAAITAKFERLSFCCIIVHCTGLVQP